MNHNEHIPLPTEAEKLDLGRLRELLTLWHEPTRDYSEEYLAATICTELEHQFRVGATDEMPEIKEAQNLLLKGRIGERALADIEAKSLFDAARSYVKDFETRKVRGEERAREGFTILSDYDALQLLLRAVKKAPLNATARSKLRKHQRILTQVTRMLERNLLAFYAVSQIANDYCVTWNVEEGSILSRVAELGSRDLEIVWAERNRRPELLPETTPECLDENLLASGFEGRLKGAQLERFDNHVAACRRCAGLLDEMTKSFIRMPARIPKAPLVYMPKQVRPEPKLGGWIKAVIEVVYDFFVTLQPVVLNAADAVTESKTASELENRKVLFEDKTTQVVLFVRGEKLCLSIFSNKVGVVHGVKIREVRKRKPLQLQKEGHKKGELLYTVGALNQFLGRTLQVHFRVGARQVQQKIRIKEAAPKFSDNKVPL